MDLRVAIRAGNILRSLIVDRAGRRYRMRERTHICLRVALQAERIDVADVEKARIGRSVRRVACRAAFGLDHGMFINKRPGCFCMAFSADSILIVGRTHHLVLKRAMWVMAIAALHQSFIHFVMEGLRKCRLHVGVAGVAELGLRNPEQARLILKAVNTMATGAAHTGFAVSRPLEVGMGSLVATEAGLANILCRCFTEAKYLGDIAATLDMGFPRPVTTFAGRSLAAMHQGETGVGVGAEFLSNVCVASLACIRTDEVGGVGGGARLLSYGYCLLWLLVCSFDQIDCPKSRYQRNQRQTYEETLHSAPCRKGLDTLLC